MYIIATDIHNKSLCFNLIFFFSNHLEEKQAVVFYNTEKIPTGH